MIIFLPKTRHYFKCQSKALNIRILILHLNFFPLIPFKILPKFNLLQFHLIAEAERAFLNTLTSSNFFNSKLEALLTNRKR